MVADLGVGHLIDDGNDFHQSCLIISGVHNMNMFHNMILIAGIEEDHQIPIEEKVEVGLLKGDYLKNAHLHQKNHLKS